MAEARHILVVGAGIAGSMLAYWLGKGGFQVTVIERSPNVSKYGQGIDLEGPSRRVVEKMEGVLERIQAKTTVEQGFAVLDDDAKPIAAIKGGVTRSIEIMRSDMCEIFTNAAEAFDNVKFQYGCTIAELEHRDNCVAVTFTNGNKTNFHAVIGADGLRSKTRNLALDVDDTSDCVKARNQYCAFFRIPREEQDGTNSRVQNATGHLSLLVRPVDESSSSAYLNVVTKSEKLENVIGADKQVQMTALAEIFEGVGGEAPRVVREMVKVDDFYFEQLAQIKLRTWVKGRCTLIGDAAYAPAPITGEGTNLAITGAYIVAGELTETPDDPNAAFKRYEQKLRPYVEECQKVPLGGYAPQLVHPQTAWGIWALRNVFWLVAKSSIWKLFDPGESGGMQLPSYPKLETTSAVV